MDNPTNTHENPDAEDAYARSVGINIQRLRKSRGMIQKDLAVQMQHRGLTAWRQQTVVRIEQGLTRLRFDEALALAEILDVPVTALAGNPDTHTPITQLRTARHDASVALAHLDAAVGDFLDTQEILQSLLRELVADGEHESLPEDELRMAHNVARVQVNHWLENRFTARMVGMELQDERPDEDFDPKVWR